MKRGYQRCISRELLSVVSKLASYPRHLTDIQSRIYISQNWNETIAQRNGTIRRGNLIPIKCPQNDSVRPALLCRQSLEQDAA